MYVPIGGYWGKQFEFVHLLGTLEVVSKTSSPNYNNMFIPLQQLAKRGTYISRDYYRETTQPFLFQHHFEHVFLLTSDVFEFLCKA
jgi:hypothetical protein